MMDKVREPRNSEYYTLLSEAFKDLLVLIKVAEIHLAVLHRQIGDKY
jgi:hypothetical protein